MVWGTPAFLGNLHMSIEIQVPGFFFLCFSAGFHLDFFRTQMWMGQNHSKPTTRLDFSGINIHSPVIFGSLQCGAPKMLSWFTTPITMVYGTYNYSYGDSKTNLKLGGPTLYQLFFAFPEIQVRAAVERLSLGPDSWDSEKKKWGCLKWKQSMVF